MGLLFLRKGNVMKKELSKAVLVDIDGTLVEITEFDYSVFGKGEEVVSEYLKEWDKKTMEATVLVAGVEKLVEFKKMGYKLVFLTARGQSCKKYTWMKMKEMGIDGLVDGMWHRPVRWEGKKSAVYKAAMIKMLMKKYDFEWAMDDEDGNLEIMKGFGMKVIDAKGWW